MPGTSEIYWLAQIAKHNAIFVRRISEAARYPDRAIAFETENFGWILSAQQGPNNTRTVLLKY